MSRAVMQQALEALEHVWNTTPDDDPIVDKAILALRAALAEPEQEPVAHSVIAGALFDFMGWLTSRRERLVLSSVDNAAPAADAIKDFAEMRGLNIDDALVKEWQDNITAPTPRKPLTYDELEPLCEAFDSYDTTQNELVEFARAIERAHGIGEQHE